MSLASTTGYVRDGLPDKTLIEAEATAQLVWRGEGPRRNLMDRLGETRSYTSSLRGGHDFHFIPVNGVIDLKLSIQDVNRNRGANSVAFRLTQADDVLWTDAIGVSGIRDTRPTKVYEKSIRVTDLRPGVYRLSVIADDDILSVVSRRRQSTGFGSAVVFWRVNGFATSTTPGAL